MNETLLDELAALSRPFYRLIDPKLTTKEQAVVVTTIAGEVHELLARLYELDLSARVMLEQRMRAISDEVLGERRAAVH